MSLQPTSMITSESCLSQVRWNDGVLEQVWVILEYSEAGALIGQRREWRPVPGNPKPPEDKVQGGTTYGFKSSPIKE